MKKITILVMLVSFLGFSQTIPVDFESNIIIGDNWKADSGLASVAVTDDPITSGKGKVGQINSAASGQPWQNAQLKMTTNYLDLTNATGSKIITVDIYTTAAQSFLLKLESTKDGVTGNTEKSFTTAGSGWETINVDFSTPDQGDVPNDQYALVVLFPCYSPGFGTPPFDGTTYVDNVSGTVGAAIAPAVPNEVTVDVNANWIAYMNWFNTPADGGGFAGGDGWAVVDVKTTIGAENITLQPNFSTYANAVGGDDAARAYWTNSPDNGVTAGPTGNKIMEASTFVEPGASFNGSDLTFSGEIVSNTIDGEYTAQFFIKALDPNNGFSDALGGSKVMTLPASGSFSVSATGAELAPGLIIQYGFAINGLNANPADEVALGSVVVGASTLSTSRVTDAEFKVYPNPTQNTWNIKSLDSEITSINVIDVLGKTVMSLNPNSSNAIVNASSLKTGLYFAVVETLSGVESIKLIKN
ncbi:T9SS type A sorting domain-containing protein [Cognatitamlana onchidii]|uniref:T9SS type A sorting domain-containing protein n=1 Tax=Cognatitamlana onchidii TaxID=2562860 RepID=UPI0010A5C1A3|nr:T9SS type A sorting domain-containing protein [Algibacter onchidii]